MPDFHQYSVALTGNNASVTLPEVAIRVKVVREDGTVLLDTTGTPVLFPEVLASFTAPQRAALLELLISHMIRIKAGLE